MNFHRSNIQFITGSHLKLLAILFMTIDHVSAFLLGGGAWIHNTLFTLADHKISTYFLLRCIGRLAFPIFAFLIVEGFKHTRNRFKYGRNLFLFACLSEIPWDLARSNTYFCSGQNVFFTLFIGYLGLCTIDTYQTAKIKKLIFLILLFVVSILLRPDYGCSGFGLILLLYALYNDKLLKSIIGCCILSSKWIAGLAFIPISMYNGKRGFIKTTIGKYIFYIYNPLHLLLIYILRQKLY